MPLSPSTRFGPYEILAPLGAGGMGEVYRARDTRLNRDVALKVLPAEVSADPARRARFEQEARAAAALNHPNIVGTHDVGDQDGVFYIVSELVPGDTLAALLEQGPLPIKKLLDLSVQLADGIAAAHAARITHRDLKPANVIVTPEGRAKILDFGLAKQTAIAAAAQDATVTVQQTQPGMILGTVNYMSPEQARGKAVDYRSDQFSFGVMLYEMASGKKAFEKPETVQTMSAILTEDPPPIDRDLPAPLRWTIDRCLAKDPADRYESSGDLFRELRQIRDYVGSKSGASQMVAALDAPVVKPRRRVRWIFPVVGTLGLAGALALGLYLAPQRFPDQSAYAFTPFAFEPGGQSSPVWSPDGKAIAYAGHPDGPDAPTQVMVRYLDSPMPRQVTHVPEGASPIGWAPDNMRILFTSRRPPSGIWSASVVGGEPDSFMAVEATAVGLSPDARTVAAVRGGEEGLNSVWISSPPGSPFQKYPSDPIHSRALFNQTHIRFSPDGKSILLNFRTDRDADEIWRLPYPPAPSAPPKRVLPNLRSFSSLDFAWLPDNRRVVLAMAAAPTTPGQLWLGDLSSGKLTQLTGGTTPHSEPIVSPSGDRIAFRENLRDVDIVTVDLARGAAERLIATDRSESMPAWAANAHALVYLTDRQGVPEIWLRDHAGDRPIVTPRDFPPGTTQWFIAPTLSPDGSRVAYERFEYAGSVHMWISSVSGGSPVRVTSDVSTEFPGSWSHDGNWLAYMALHNGSPDLMKVKTSGQAAPQLVKAGLRGEIPEWSPSGEWIVFSNRLVSPDGKTVRDLPDNNSPNLTFSRDGKLLYGIRRDTAGPELFSIDVASGALKPIAKLPRDFQPNSDLRPGVRLSLSPDGGSIAYGAFTIHSNLWILSGALKP
jgi:eukaryotic-like serine/threonine-protein kinase